MWLLRTFLESIFWLAHTALTLYMWAFIVRALISWVSPDPANPIVVFLYRITEPVLGPLRRWLPMQSWNIDISPILAILAISFVNRLLSGVFVELLRYMQ